MGEVNRMALEQILVTGGGGFLGKAVIKQLIEHAPCQVASLCRRRYPDLEPLGVKQIQGDIRDPETVSEACKGVDLVFHTAAKPGVWGDYKEYEDINVGGTRNVIAACRRNKVRRLVHTSSPSVVFDSGDMEGADESAPYPESYKTHYPKTKAMAEQLVRDATDRTFRTVILRPHLIWGPGDNHLVPRILDRARKLFRVGDGKNLVDTIYIDNAARAHLLAAETLAANPKISGNIYFISQDDPVPLWNMVDNILKAGGFPPVRRTISRKTAFRAGALAELAYTIFKIKGEPKMTRFLAEELSTSHWFDISAAKRDLGYAPVVSIQEGLERLEQWCRDEGLGAWSKSRG